jgi:hypothetical protein
MTVGTDNLEVLPRGGELSNEDLELYAKTSAAGLVRALDEVRRGENDVFRALFVVDPTLHANNSAASLHARTHDIFLAELGIDPSRLEFDADAANSLLSLGDIALTASYQRYDSGRVHTVWYQAQAESATVPSVLA